MISEQTSAVSESIDIFIIIYPYSVNNLQWDTCIIYNIENELI